MTENLDNLEGLCDEEKSFILWLRNNHFSLSLNIPPFEIAKVAYMQGYAAGFDAKGKYSADEQLQK